MSRLRQAASGTAAVLLMFAALPTGSGASAASEVNVTATLTINPLAVEFDLPPRPVSAGQEVRARATVRNLGDAPVEEVVATIHVSEPNVTVVGGAEREIGVLLGGRRAQVAWQLCSDQPDTYLVLVRAEGALDGVPVAAQSAARQLTIANAPGRCPSGCPG